MEECVSSSSKLTRALKCTFCESLKIKNDALVLDAWAKEDEAERLEAIGEIVGMIPTEVF